MSKYIVQKSYEAFVAVTDIGKGYYEPRAAEVMVEADNGRQAISKAIAIWKSQPYSVYLKELLDGLNPRKGIKAWLDPARFLTEPEGENNEA